MVGDHVWFDVRRGAQVPWVGRSAGIGRSRSRLIVPSLRGNSKRHRRGQVGRSLGGCLGSNSDDDLVGARRKRRSDPTVAARGATDNRNRPRLARDDTRGVAGSANPSAEHADHLARAGAHDDGLEGLAGVHREAARTSLADDDDGIEH